MPMSSSANAGWTANRRQAAATLVSPAHRVRPMTVLHNAASLCVILPQRTCPQPRRRDWLPTYRDLPLSKPCGGSPHRATGGKTQGLRQTCPIVTPPLRHCRITPVPTQQGATHQSQGRGQQVTFSLMTAEIRNLGQDLDERTRLCY